MVYELSGGHFGFAFLYEAGYLIGVKYLLCCPSSQLRWHFL